MKTAFVTGASGFVGINFIKELVENNWKITVLHRKNSNLEKLKIFDIQFAEGDITDYPALLEAIPENTFAAFHLAGDTTAWRLKNKRQNQINVVGTQNIVKAALQKKVKKLIYTSSITIYGFHDQVINEQSPKLGEFSRINYIKSKWLAEQEILKGISKGLNAVIINPGHILGPYDYNTWSQLFLLVDKNKLPGIPPGSGSFCHVQDVAKALIAAAEKGQSGKNYLLGGDEVSFFELIQTIGKKLNRKVPKRTTPAWMTTDPML